MLKGGVVLIQIYKLNVEDITGINNSLYVTECGFSRFNDRDYHYIREHGRDDYHLIYMVKNFGEVYIKDKKNQISSGAVAIIKPHEKHGYHMLCKNAPEYFWIHFSGEKAEEFLSSLNLSENYFFNIGISEDILKTFNRIINELQTKSLNYIHFCNSYLLNLLSYLSRKISYSKQYSPKDNKSIKNIVLVINNEYMYNPPVEEYAKLCNYSKYYFIKLFTEITGYTPAEYRNMVRIEKACLLIANSPYNLSEIAVMTGFSDPSYFTKVFKKYAGQSPSQYKDSLKQ